jgi:hypothetical protein
MGSFGQKPKISCSLFVVRCRGLYIGKYPPPPLGGGRKKYQPMSVGGKNMKRPREKAENVEEKGRTGKENEKRGSKRVK